MIETAIMPLQSDAVNEFVMVYFTMALKPSAITR